MLPCSWHWPPRTGAALLAMAPAAFGEQMHGVAVTTGTAPKSQGTQSLMRHSHGSCAGLPASLEQELAALCSPGSAASLPEAYTQARRAHYKLKE